LSVNDVLGSAAINLVILGIADATFGRGALTSLQASPIVLLQAVLGIILMALAMGAVVAGDVLIFGIGAWCWLMLAVYLLAIWLLAKSRAGDAWHPASRESDRKVDETGENDRGGLGRLIRQTVAAGAFILVAGFLLASTGDAIAEQTGLGTSFFGAVFLGFSTSLPEISTVIAAVRLKRYEMAISDIFGTNLFNVTIIVLVDALYPGDSVLVEAGRFASFSALLALLLTTLFLVGLIERRDRTVMRMGIDSLASFFIYGAGVAVLYTLK
jgi:cation:H+ antiporter